MTKYGLRAQVIAFTILPTVLIGGILAGYFSFHRYQQANELLINRAINIAEPLAIASEYGMQDETRTILRRLIGATHRKNSPIIKSIAIFTEDNDLFVISNYHRDYQQLRLEEGLPIPDLPEVKILDKSIIIYSPIIDETNFLEYQLSFDQPRKVIGYVALEINRDEVELLLYRDTAISIFVVLLGILGSLYLAFRQAKRITAPISEMASVVEKISLGRLNSRVEGEYTGEISLLQHGINEMALAMSKHHEEMQDSIDLATSELRETLDQMEVQNIELDITRKEAQQAASVKSEFLANMSHELRTPLNGVIGFARQLLKTKMTNNQIDYLQTIERSAGNLLNIINDILDFSKLEAGKLDLEYIPFDIRECLDETMHLLAQSAHEKNIELSMLVDTDVPHEIVGDSMRLQQILTNLIGNAVKFTEQGNIEVQIQRMITEKHTITDKNIKLKFTISDTGIGISESQQQQLFKAFGQADSSITRQYGGTGLGLVITQKLVRQMKGNIDLVSQPNIGSTFSFTIETEKCTRTPMSLLPLERLSGRSILAYESNEYAVKACSQLLSQWGTESTITETELQWSKAITKRYDSIVIGHSNNTNLRPLLSHIQQAKEHTDNIIVLMNSSDPSVYELLMDTGITHCLSKPINHKNFANALVSNETTPSQLQVTVPLQRKNINVMAVDDNPANLKLISAMLSDRVNRVTTCKNGQEAVEHAKQIPFDIIFMDIQMPVLDGVSACAQIKKDSLNQESPIIAVTAHVLPGEKEQFLQKGMDDCLAKPIDETALQSIINKWAPNAKIIEALPPQNIANIKPKISESNNNKSFDWSLALKQSAGKTDLAKEMIAVQLAEFESISIIANQAMANEISSRDFTQAIHKFHGGCSYSGVPKLSKIAGLIEQELKLGVDPDLLEPELLELLDELDNVKEEAKPYLT